MSVPCIPVQHWLKLVQFLSSIPDFHLHCNSQWVWHNMLVPKYTSAYHWAHFYIHYLLYSLSLTHALEKAKSLTTIHKNYREWPVGGLDVTILDKFSPTWNYWTIIFATKGIWKIWEYDSIILVKCDINWLSFQVQLICSFLLEMVEHLSRK